VTRAGAPAPHLPDARSAAQTWGMPCIHAARVVRATSLVALLLAAACSRRSSSSPAPAPAAPDTATEPAISRARTVTLPFGEDDVTVSGRSDERVEVVVTGADTMTLAFALPAVDEFLPAAMRLAMRGRLRRERPNLTRALIDEPGGDGGALSLSRRVNGRVLTCRLFFSDNVGGGFAITVSPAEARAVLQAMREAADAVRPPPPAPPPTRRRPTRRTAKPKATPKTTPDSTSETPPKSPP
jgi:hypothetical protein